MKPKRTILCVDDNEQSLSIRKVMLETRGYRVVTCTSGQEALERFKNGGVDLVMTDLIMPGLDGGKLIDAIKTLSPQTPAILLSGKVRIYDRDTRADVFLPKGMYAPAELLERVRLLLVRKRVPSARRPATTAPVKPGLRKQIKVKVTGGGQVCPPHTNVMWARASSLVRPDLRFCIGIQSARAAASCNIDGLDACLYRSRGTAQDLPRGPN